MSAAKSKTIPCSFPPTSALGTPCSSLLTIHPTSLSLRQLQRRQLETNAFFDSRGHITFSSLLRDCASSALLPPSPRESGIQNPESRIDNQTGPKSKVHGLRSVPPPPPTPLRPLTDLDRELAIVETISRFRSSSAGKGNILSALAPAALEETLAQLIDTVAPLADRAPDFLALLAADTRTPKNPELAALYAAYANVCLSLGVADDATLNAAILKMLSGPREHWPLVLRQATTVTFEAIRWVAPFQESFIQALVARLGPDNVIIRHILTDYEQDWWGGALIGGAGRLLFGDPQSAAEDGQYHSPATRAAIEGLVSLREGYAMQDPALAGKARSCVGFSCSVGIYGEIEDLARRIAWELQDRPDPLRPEDICLVTRNLGAASDAIMDVFTRFQIPFYFRRGVPILSLPIVKTFVNLARFSATLERDLFCALLQSPWINWSAMFSSSPEPRLVLRSPAKRNEGGTLNPEPPIHHSPFTIHDPHPLFDPTLLADDILRSGVEPVMDDPDRIARRLTAYLLHKHRFDDRSGAEAYVANALQVFRSALGNTNIRTFDAGLTDLLRRAAHLHLESDLNPDLSSVVPPPSGTKEKPSSPLPPSSAPSAAPTLRHAFLLNAKAWETVSDTLARLQRHTLLNRNDGAQITWNEIVDLLNRTLENVTVSATPPDESGVWILNPYDIAGLQFKLVLVAGLNAGAFPKSPSPSPLFPDAELLTFREKLLSSPPINHQPLVARGEPSTIPPSPSSISHSQLVARGAPFTTHNSPSPPPSPLPVAALAASKARNSQENLLFLTTLAAARERMVFSYAAHDETGQDQPPSVFFSTLWRLVGWPAYETLPPEPPDPYDQWRLKKEPAHLQSHWHQKTPGKDAFKRRPFPGESYLGTIPLALCRANDERCQRLAHSPLSLESGIQNPEVRIENQTGLKSKACHATSVIQGLRSPPLPSTAEPMNRDLSAVVPPGGTKAEPPNLLLHISHAIHVEHQRQAFFNRQNQTASTNHSPPARHFPPSPTEPPNREPLNRDLSAAVPPSGTKEEPPLSSTPGHDYAGILDPNLWKSIRASLQSKILDFSPSQLECLITCPYKYYLRYILNAEPIEPNDLEPRDQDFGTAIHDIMCIGFRMLQGEPLPNHTHLPASLSKTAASLRHPLWAIQNRSRSWRLQESPVRPSPEAIPLAACRPGNTEAVLAFFESLADAMLDWATSGNAVWRLGATEQLHLQRLRILRNIRNLVRTALTPDALPEYILDLATTSPDNAQPLRRFPALLEYVFDSRRQPEHRNADSIELANPSDPAHKIRLHGKIDRVDLVFNAEGKLQAAIVVDYKGKSKSADNINAVKLLTGIATASDCQLPAYALAAANALGVAPESRIQKSGVRIDNQKGLKSSALGAHSSPLPSLFMQYLSYSQSCDAMLKQCRKQTLALDGSPLDEEDLAGALGNHASLTEAFLASIFHALNRYECGNFAVAPEQCDYCDYKACCRHAASLLTPESNGHGEES